MFVFDTAPVPQQPAAIIVADASESRARVVGICHLVNNLPGNPPSAEHIISPGGSASAYLWNYEQRTVTGPIRVTTIEQPKRGILKAHGDGIYSYLPEHGYYGRDRASAIVKLGPVKVTVIYFFQARDHPIGNRTDAELCGKRGTVWKISDGAGGMSSPTA